MSDLRRFPVSDEFISYRQTLDSVCDRMIFWGGKYGNVGNDLAHRVEVLSGACGASFRSKSSREVRIGHKCTFFQSFRKFEKWEMPKKMLAMQSELCLSGWNRSGVNRWPGGRARSRSGARPSRKPRVRPICFAGYPIFDLAVF